jgi:superfamily II DNA/RNA helicase
MNLFINQLDDVFFNSKYNNPHAPDDKKLIIFTEAIPTVYFLLANIDSTRHEGKALAITAKQLENNREIVAANFDANYEGERKNDYEILITTDVLAEGVNLHRSNVILNYDSPWNSTRLMQRLGRLNRIGTEADFINVYNYYPSSQGDAEINLIERTWNKLQAFHQLFGEDSKIFSTEEELVVHDIIQHEEDEGDTSLKYVEELKRFRTKCPTRYAELENLAERVLSACQADSKEIVAQVKNAADEDFCYSYTDKAVFISKTEMLARLECNEDAKIIEPDNKLYQDAVTAILDCYTRERQNAKIHLRTKHGSKKQKDNAMEILRSFANNPELSEDEKSILQALSQAVRNGNNSLIRDINNESSFDDLSSLTKYLNADKIKDDETGIVTLAMERQSGH